jgi:alpha-L-fucosidase 2
LTAGSFCLVVCALPALGAVQENIEYGQAGDISLRMDAHIPDGPGPFPAAILVHGGGWIRGDRKHDVEPLFAPLEKAGYAWFSISYRLANDNNGISSLLFLGDAVSDVRQAVGFVQKHAADYNIDPDRIALIGESAGAQLASMAALKPGNTKPVQAVVAFYGPSDLAAMAENSDQIPDSIREKVKSSGWGDMLMAGLKAVSPINFVKPGMPPFLLIHGTADSLVPFSQSEAMCDAIHRVGASCELYAVRGVGHGIRGWDARHETAYKRHMIEWLNRELKPQPSAARRFQTSTARS